MRIVKKKRPRNKWPLERAARFSRSVEKFFLDRFTRAEKKKTTERLLEKKNADDFRVISTRFKSCFFSSCLTGLRKSVKKKTKKKKRTRKRSTCRKRAADIGNGETNRSREFSNRTRSRTQTENHIRPAFRTPAVFDYYGETLCNVLF